VHLAYAAESSVKRSLGFDVQYDGIFSFKTQDYSCEKSTDKRRIK